MGIHKTTPKAKSTNNTIKTIIKSVPRPIPGPMYNVIMF
jgi:hypothetical protein